MSQDEFHKYRDTVYLLNLDFQWTEELLKLMIGSSYEAIRRSAPRKIRFSLTRKHVEKESLGKLIDRYAQVSRNDELIVVLRGIAKERNYCAHKSFVLSLEEQADSEFLRSETERLSVVRQRSRKCVSTLREELAELVALLNETPNNTVERDAPKIARRSP